MIKTLLSAVFTAIMAVTVNAQWQTVGTAGFSAGQADYTSLAFSSSNEPYVAFKDGDNSGKATVMKFNGTNWVTVGKAGFSTGLSDYTSLAFSNSNEPYVAFKDGADSGKATVMKFNGTNWVTVGTAGFSVGQAYYISLAFSSSNEPYVAYQDGGNSVKATVKKFDGTNWVTVGTAGFSAGSAPYTSLAFSNSNEPYVTYADGGNLDKTTVMKFDGTNWVTVGTAGFSAGQTNYTSLAFSNNNEPYVAYTDFANSYKATVMKFDGTNWVAVGTAGFSAGLAPFTSIAFSNSNEPYVAYRDFANSNKATVMKFPIHATGIDTQTGCGSFTWIDGNTYTSSNNTATHTIVGGAVDGRDSIVTLNLTILNPVAGIDTQIGCGSFIWIDGNTYTSSNNTATHTIVGGAANGCDSIVTLNLTMNNINITTTVSGATISANQSGATYQWVDCDNNNAAIAGAIAQSFSPSVTGNYAVEITFHGCTATSACQAVNVLSIENLKKTNITLYPNPASTITTIAGLAVGQSLQVMDVTGKLVYQTVVKSSTLELELTNFENGVYIIQVEQNGAVAQKTLIVNK